MPLLRGILVAAERRGIDVAIALARLDIKAGDLVVSDRRVPRSTFYQLWDVLAQLSGDQDLGIHLAESAEVGDFAVLDYAIRNSPTLGAGYHQAARYSHVLHNGVDVSHEVENGVASMHYGEAAGSPRHVAEWIISAWLVVGRQIVGESWKPHAVQFQHPPPADLSEHKRLFITEPAFRAADNRLSLDAQLLERRVVLADPQLFRVVGEFARQLLEGVPRTQSSRDQVKHVVAERLGHGEVSLEEVAKQLDVAPRTLQRKLKGDGATFQTVLDEVRLVLASRYLADPTLAVEETAFLVGFSEPSAFNRAFKRWTGETPSSYRAAL